MNEQDRLVRVIAAHFGVADLDTHPDGNLVGSIRELARKIIGEGLPGLEPFAGMVDAEGARLILGLGSVRSLRTTITRDKTFPAPAVNGQLWLAKDIEQYRRQREQNRLGHQGRPPASSRRHQQVSQEQKETAQPQVKSSSEPN
jgi:hypothetical protein